MVATNAEFRGLGTNRAAWKRPGTAIGTTAGEITVSMTNGQPYVHYLTNATTIVLANSTDDLGVKIKSYPDGVASYTFPAGVQSLIGTISQPLPAGYYEIDIWRENGTNYLAISPDPTTYLTPNSTNTITNKKFTEFAPFAYPHRWDGVGATVVTNAAATSINGYVTYSGSADTNVNYATFIPGSAFVPFDLDTNVVMTLYLAVRVAGTDTDAIEFSIGQFSPANSAGYAPTDFTSFSQILIFDSGAVSSPAAEDGFVIGPISLTHWAPNLTAGRTWSIGIARRNGSNDDAVTITRGVITYSRRTQ